MRRGFSLIEVLLAIFLMAAGIATTAALISVATRGLAQSKLTTQAIWFAQERMEVALVSPGTAAATDVDPDVPDLTGEIQRFPFANGLVRTKVLVYRTGDPSKHPLMELESL